MKKRELRKLSRAFYHRDAEIVARDLLGKYLIRKLKGGKACVGRIVEVEAYLGPHDRASHSSRGRTKRTEVMFGPPGHLYVYLIYGIHCCLNVVTGAEGFASAVLIRALEPVAQLSEHTNGPGLLCKAVGIDRTFNGHDLLSDNLFIAGRRGERRETIVKRPRIGVDYAGSWARRHLRFYMKGNRFISRR